MSIEVMGYILGVNCLFTVCYIIVKKKRKESAKLAIFFMILPILGYVICLLPCLVQRMIGRAAYDRESLVHRLRLDKAMEHPNLEEALSVVSVGDALAVSSTMEKRKLLLNQLKKDVRQNYRSLLAAQADTDSESVHYVAAARMEVYRIQQQKWMSAFKAYQKDTQNAETFEAACNALQELIDGRLLSEREQVMYWERYCTLVRRQEFEHPELVSKEIYTAYLGCLTALGRIEEAKRLWRDKHEMLRNEVCYMRMAELFYEQKDQEAFEDCIRKLCADQRVHLSARGLETLRYWNEGIVGCCH